MSQSFTSFDIQKLSPGFLLLLMTNITLQNSYKDNYDDCCLANIGCTTINCKMYSNYRDVKMLKKKKVHLRSDEIIFQFGSLTVFKGMLWCLKIVLLLI